MDIENKKMKKALPSTIANEKLREIRNKYQEMRVEDLKMTIPSENNLAEGQKIHSKPKLLQPKNKILDLFTSSITTTAAPNKVIPRGQKLR